MQMQAEQASVQPCTKPGGGRFFSQSRLIYTREAQAEAEAEAEANAEAPTRDDAA